MAGVSTWRRRAESVRNNVMEPGRAVATLHRLGRQYVAVIRIFVLLPTSVVALLIVREAPDSALLVAELAVTGAWSVGYVVMLLHGPTTWVTLADAVVLAGLCLSSPWIVAPSWLTDGRSWLLPLVAFSCVGYQYYASRLLGTVASFVVVGAAIAGTALALPAGAKLDSVVTASWSVIAALLARVLWILVNRGGERADLIAADAERARVAQTVASARRTEELAHNRNLHDTAASTLLMVGIGQASDVPGLLAAQARQDLMALRAWGETLPAGTDLIRQLHGVIELVPLSVEFLGPERLELPTPVVRAVSAATGEALRNVARHARTAGCRVRVDGSPYRACVEIVDDGVGFDVDTVAPSRRGVRGSIHDRMSTVGGCAHVRSAPGHGTTVWLGWQR